MWTFLKRAQSFFLGFLRQDIGRIFREALSHSDKYFEL